MQSRNNSLSSDPIANPNSLGSLRLFRPEDRLKDFNYAYASSSPEFTGIMDGCDRCVLSSQTFRKFSDPCLNDTVRLSSGISLLHVHPCPNAWTVAPHSRISRSSNQPPDGWAFRNCSCFVKDLKIVKKCLSTSRTGGLTGCCISCSGLLRSFSKQAATNLWSVIRPSVRSSVSPKRMNHSPTTGDSKPDSQLPRFHQETERTHIGSRLNLNRLVLDGDSSTTGLFSANSLESLLFELLEKRSNTDFVNFRELELKRSSAFHIMLPNSLCDETPKTHSKKPPCSHCLEPNPAFFDASDTDCNYASVRMQCCYEHDQHRKRLWS